LTIALLIFCAFLIGALVFQGWLHAKETRIREDAWRLERKGLLDRIQAPEVVPFLDEEPSGEPDYARFDDDSEYQ